ncbi:glycosyltransferase family 1 protein [Bradyrhizobium sp. AUGA SZCCT0274]|uniref:glycosyltransferase n=1 Tax=Bradyrhizobium sp. AUGA SZCCT0274 TaxID=2807670 RepID=UPI001BA54F93|nr:glycosyltransferase [Bradyrhizobium sp. AUGA SZCCT0274]MBR1244178.1 glycosyltransferase family 1 protein [Bradyrhizobium sp. AUGA SZCCT0274]
MRVLVGHARYTDRLSYYDDWLDAFERAPQFDCVPFDIVAAESGPRLSALLREVDAVVLLHSTNGDTTVYLDPHLEALARREVPLLSFVGNEVSLPGSPIADKRRVFSVLKPEYIATQLRLESGKYLFSDVASRKVVAVPHALNPAAYRPVRAIGDRPLDIGARAVKYLPHLGDDDRNRLMQWIATNGSRLGLKVEISDQRLDRKGWADYLNQCKATVSTEAGTWFLERDDATVNAIREYVLAKPAGRFVLRNDSALRRLGHKMPWWMRSMARRAMRSGPIRHEALVNEQLDYDDIFERFFKGRVPPSHDGKCISSRHFDAAGTKTCQIMFRGRFNDIFVADEHYFALERDFSNLDEVLATFHDPVKRQRVVDAAYDLAHTGHTYAHRMQQVYDLLAGADRP